VITHGETCCRFWEAVQQLKALPQKDVQDKVDEIWAEFLASDASCPINVDSRSYEITKKNMGTLDRWSFDVAAVSTHTVVTRVPEELVSYCSSIA
jgi:regulator of G-protein signaling